MTSRENQESHDAVPENGTVAVIGPIRERNVVPVNMSCRTAVSLGGTLRDIAKKNKAAKETSDNATAPKLTYCPYRRFSLFATTIA